jgi:aminoglycoside phosphotransferase family enzyme/gluconate kinase
MLLLMQNSLIQALLNPAVYPFSVETVELIETHISWVLLTGNAAYKIKKPVDFGFLDFSTLEQRKHCCEEEIRLNRRFAPDIYQRVVAITGPLESPQLNGDGEVLEYAVQMQQFEADQTLDKIAGESGLDNTLLSDIARKLALFHRSLETEAATPAPEGEAPYGSPETVWAAVQQNFDQIRPLLCQSIAIEQLDQIEAWASRQFDKLELLIRARRATGFVRDCHGDMHLRNMALHQGEVIFFDCIEFNPGFRVIDTVSELAFLIMDLQAKQLGPQANRLLNTYLQYSGDFAGLALLPFYCSYRAMVRAKVALLQVADLPAQQIADHPDYADFISYLELANSYCEQPQRFLAITHGVSGTGKSTVAAELASQCQAIQLRSDVERKRLFGLDPQERSDKSIYSADASQQTFGRLEELVEEVIGAGLPCVVDATFLQASRRDQFRQLAGRLAIPFFVLDCQAPLSVIEQRIENRNSLGTDASEATTKVMHDQLAIAEKPQAAESSCWLTIDSSKPALQDIIKQLQRGNQTNGKPAIQ